MNLQTIWLLLLLATGAINAHAKPQDSNVYQFTRVSGLRPTARKVSLRQVESLTRQFGALSRAELDAHLRTIPLDIVYGPESQVYVLPPSLPLALAALTMGIDALPVTVVAD